MTKPTVLFLCTHNAGRSQMAMGFFDGLSLNDCYILAKNESGSVSFTAERRDGPVAVSINGSEIYQHSHGSVAIHASGKIQVSKRQPRAILNLGRPGFGMCNLKDCKEKWKAPKIKGSKKYDDEW